MFSRQRPTFSYILPVHVMPRSVFIGPSELLVQRPLDILQVPLASQASLQPVSYSFTSLKSLCFALLLLQCHPCRVHKLFSPVVFRNLQYHCLFYLCCYNFNDHYIYSHILPLYYYPLIIAVSSLQSAQTIFSCCIWKPTISLFVLPVLLQLQ